MTKEQLEKAVLQLAELVEGMACYSNINFSFPYEVINRAENIIKVIKQDIKGPNVIKPNGPIKQ